MSKTGKATQNWIAAVFAAIAMIAMLPFAFASVASAHDVVIGSTPENGSVVPEFPDRIELEFSGLPQDSFNTVALNNADTGTIVYSATPSLDGQIISFEIPDSVERVPGNYTVGFQITSSDGHATKGSIDFQVAGEIPEAAAPEVSAPAEEAEIVESNGLEAPWNWIIAFVAVLAVVGVIIMMIAKNRQQK